MGNKPVRTDCHDEAMFRNVGVVAHIDAGKTTLTERILCNSGVIRTCGEVHEGTTVTDYLRQERERGISIVSSAVSCNWGPYRINLLDTPGHIDFTAEVESALSVMDSAVLVICAQHGVQAQTESIWRRAARHRLPAIVFANKVDRDGVDPHALLRDLRNKLGVVPVPLQWPVIREGCFLGLVDVLDGQIVCSAVKTPWQPDTHELLQLLELRDNLLEVLAESDEELLTAYLLNTEPQRDSVQRALRQAVAAVQVVPVLWGSALRNIGVRELLDSITDILPPPVPYQRPLHRQPGVLAMVFKVQPDGPEGVIAAVRVYRGTVCCGDRLYGGSEATPYTVSGIYRLQGCLAEAEECLDAGDVAALVLEGGCPGPGDLLADLADSLHAETMIFPKPVVSLTLATAGDTTSTELGRALIRAATEDPTLKAVYDADTGLWTLQGLGELQLEVVIARLAEEGVNVRCGEPQVNYRETVSRTVTVEHTFCKQLAPGRCRRAGITLRVEPLPRMYGVFIDLQPADTVPDDCRKAAVRGLQDVIESGLQQGYPLTDVRVTALNFVYDADESSDLAFQAVARQALLDAVEQAGRLSLEPVARVEVRAPQDQIGHVIADLTARKGRITELETLAPGDSRIIGVVPLSEMFGYATALRSITGGRAEFVAEPTSYEIRISTVTQGSEKG